MRDAAPGGDVPRQRQRGQRGGHDHRCAGPGDAERGKRPQPEDQAGRQWYKQNNSGADSQRRHPHIAAAANDTAERVHQPHERGTREHDIRILKRRIKRGALAAQGPVQGQPERQHQGGAHDPDRHIDDDRMQHQRVRIVAAPAAEGAGDRRGNAAAHRAGR